MFGRSSVGHHRLVGSLGEGERSEANSSPRVPSVLLSLGSVKTTELESDCFKREIWDFVLYVPSVLFWAMGHVSDCFYWKPQWENFEFGR